MEYTPFWEAGSEIPSCLWNPRVSYVVTRSRYLFLSKASWIQSTLSHPISSSSHLSLGLRNALPTSSD
jgi:hypothetical protein